MDIYGTLHLMIAEYSFSLDAYKTFSNTGYKISLNEFKDWNYTKQVWSKQKYIRASPIENAGKSELFGN